MEGKMNLGFNLNNVGILGRNLYVGTPQYYSIIGTEEIVKYAAKAASVAQSAMLNTFIALYDAFEYYLCNGHSFKLDGIGTFSLSLSASTADPTAADTVSGADAINGIGVNYLPDKEVKAMLAGIAWKSIVNKSGLVEFTDFVHRKIVLGSDSCNLLNYKSNEGHSLAVGDIITFVGWNCPENVTVKVDGIDASGAAANETFTLEALGKKNQLMMSATAKATVAIPTVQKITIGETEYVYTGTSKSVRVAAGSHAIFNGSSFVNGSYVLAFTGSDLTDLVATLDGKTLTFASKTTTSAKTASINLQAGSHILVVNDETLTFDCTETPVASVYALSANGITVLNGSTSSMRSGVSYAFVATGQNLNLLSQRDISLPTGSTISNFTVSSDGTRLQFNVVYGGNEGPLKIGSFFTVNVITTSTTGANITSIDDIADGGTMTVEGEYSVIKEVLGTNLTDVTYKLTNKATGVDVTGIALSWSEDKTQLTFASPLEGPYNLVAYNADMESIYTCNINANVWYGENDFN